MISRFAVHHFPDPIVALAEMLRVCRPDGRVAVMDLIVAEPELADAYNDRERLRDPSHTRALSAEEMKAAMSAAGLEVGEVVESDRSILLDRWLAQTEPPDDVGARLRADLEAELGNGPATGMRPHREAGGLYFTQRWMIVLGRPPATGNPA